MNYQQATARRPRWLSWSNRAVNLAACTLALILSGGEFAGALLDRDATPIAQALDVPVMLLTAWTVTMHFSLMFRTLSLAANSISRERQGHTWDMLVLTGIDARQIVQGKWWATVNRMWRHYLLLGFLRAGVVVWASAYSSRFFSVFVHSTYTNPSYPQVKIIAPHPLHFLLAGALVVIFTLVNLVFTAACGVAASAGSGRSVFALVQAFGTRLGALISAAVSLAVFGFFLLQTEALGLLSVLGRMAVTLFDNGSTVSGELVNYQYVPSDDGDAAALIAALLALVIYAVLTWLLLQRAQRHAIHGRALPPRPYASGDRRHRSA